LLQSYFKIYLKKNCKVFEPGHNLQIVHKFSYDFDSSQNFWTTKEIHFENLKVSFCCEKFNFTRVKFTLFNNERKYFSFPLFCLVNGNRRVYSYLKISHACVILQIFSEACCWCSLFVFAIKFKKIFLVTQIWSNMSYGMDSK
jgi:hypothetical protein